MVAHTFVPVAIETLGAWGSEAQSLVEEIGRRLVVATGEVRSALFLRQRIDVALQRGNAAAILGTLPPHQPQEDRYTSDFTE